MVQLYFPEPADPEDALELLMIGPAYTQVALKTPARWPTFFLGFLFLFVGFVFFVLFDQQVHDPV